MRVLMIGDIIGRPGRKTLQAVLPGLRESLGPGLVIANGENAAGGFGITQEAAEEIIEAGVDIITTGNHVWEHKEILPSLSDGLPLLRPLNYPPGVPGKGYISIGGIVVVNLMGRVFMNNLDCPFRALDSLFGSLKNRPPVVIVDFHAEATSEKGALAWYFDGRVSVVAGTHTHVATADARVLPKGTAFVSDIGMVGPMDSVIGASPESMIKRFLTQIPQHAASVNRGPTRFNSVLIEIEDVTGHATSIVRVDREPAEDT